MIEIRLFKDQNLKGYTFIEGFPGAGLVVPMASSYMIEKLGMEYVGYLNSDMFPPIAAVKTAAIVAGSEFAAQNPTLVKAVLPAAQQIMASIDAGTSQQAINGVFQLAVSELLPQLSGNPIVLAAVQGVLTSI